MTDKATESRKTDFLAVLAEEIAWRWVQPLQEVGPLTCMLADTFDDLFRSILGSLNVAAEKAEGTLCDALGCTSDAPLDEVEWQTGSRELGLDRSGYALTTAGMAGAQRCAHALLALIPGHRRSILEAAKPEPEPPGKGESPSRGKRKSWVDELIEELTKAGATVEQITGLNKALSGASGMAAAAVAPEVVVKTLRDMVKVLKEFVDTSLERLERELDLELKKTEARALIARTVAAAGASLDIGSNKWLGTYVHQKLQEYYVAQVPDHDVVSEFPVRDNTFTLQVVYGPTARARGRQFVMLSNVAWQSDDPLYFFGILQSALTGYKLKKSSQLRSDVVDRNDRMIWEIKPVLGAEAAVWQEFLYRHSFNAFQAAVRKMGVPAGEDPLTSGGFWPTEIPVLGDIDMRGVNVPIVLTENLPRPVIPFQLGILPGLVLYLAPKTKEATDALKTFLQLLMILGVLMRSADPPDPGAGDDETLDKILDPVKKTLAKGQRAPAPTSEEVWKVVRELQRRTKEEIVDDPTGSVATGVVLAIAAIVATVVVVVVASRFGGRAAQVALVAGAVTAIIVFMGGWVVRSGGGSSLGPGDLPTEAQGAGATPGAGYQAAGRGPENLLGSVTDIALGPVVLKNVPVKEVPRLVREIAGAFDRVAAGRAIPFSLP